jgi:hypothetical protein
MSELDDQLVAEIEGIINEGQTPPETPPVDIVTPQPETVVTPPIATPEKPTIPEGYVNFKEVFPEYNEPGEVAQRLSEYQELKQKTELLNEQLANAQKTSSGYEDETLYKLAHIKKNSPEDFEIATKVLFGNPDPLSLIKMERMKKYPEMKNLTEDDWEIALSDEFGVDPFEGDPDDDDYEKNKAKWEKSKRSADVKLKLATAQAKEYLSGIVNNIEVPKPKTKEELDADNNTRINTFKSDWTPVITGVKTELNKIKLSVPGDNGQVEFLDFEIPVEQKTKYLQEIVGILFNNGSKVDANSTSLVTNYVIDRYKKEHFDNILQSALAKARAMSDDEWAKIKFNVSSPSKTETPTPGSVQSKPTTESEFEKRAGEYGF